MSRRAIALRSALFNIKLEISFQETSRATMFHFVQDGKVSN